MFIIKLNTAIIKRLIYLCVCVYEREAIQEDDEGLLEGSVAEIIQRAKRKRQAERQGNTRLGMMRHLFLVIDNSDCMSNQDLKPTRQLCTIKVIELTQSDM